MMYGYHYETPVGVLGIAVKENAVCRVSFGRLPEEITGAADYEERETDLHRDAGRQAEEYFAGRRKAFELPIKILEGTEFQRRVWTALREIPYGENRSYKEIALAAGSPKGCRAVGMANHSNPISIVVPCHRVIVKNGKLTGYGGGLNVKQMLLELEQKWKDNGEI